MDVKCAIGLALFCFASPAMALDCPTPQPYDHAGALRETPDQLAGLSNYLSTGDVSAKVPTVLADLRTRYPGAVRSEIMNYLVVAYCPDVARGPGSDADKKAALNRFVQQVEAIIY